MKNSDMAQYPAHSEGMPPYAPPPPAYMPAPTAQTYPGYGQPSQQPVMMMTPQAAAPAVNTHVNVQVGGMQQKHEMTCCAVFCALLFPPLGVCIYKNCPCCDGHVCLTFLLTLLGFLPGMIFALIVICNGW